MIADLLEYLGYPALILAFAPIAWKGDDCVSDELRKDISKSILSLNYSLSLEQWRSVASGLLSRIFGPALNSTRALAVTACFSTIVFLALTLVLVPTDYAQYYIDRDLPAPSNDTLTAKVAFFMKDIEFSQWVDLTIYGMLTLSISVLTDYVSVIQTRKLYTTRLKFLPLIALDLFLTWFIAALGVVLFLFLFLNTHFMSSFSSTWLFPDERHVSYNVAFAFLLGIALSAFCSTVWTCCVALAYLTIWAAKRMDLIFFLQYGLPFDQKPIRASAIVLFISLVLVAILWKVFSLLVGDLVGFPSQL